MTIFLLIATSFAGDYWNFDQHPKQDRVSASLMKSVPNLLFGTSGSPKISSPKQDIVRKKHHSTERDSSVEYANGIFIDSEENGHRNASGVSYTSFLEGEEELVAQNGLTAALLDSNNKKFANGNNDRLSGSSSSSEESFATILSQNSATRRDVQRKDSVRQGAKVDMCNGCCSWFLCRIRK